MAPFQSNLNRHTNAPILMFCLYSLIMYSGLTQGLYWTWASWKFFLPGWAGFFPLRLDHNFVSSNWAKPSRVKFKGLLIFRAVISIISIVIYVLICPTYYLDIWVSHSTCKPLLKPLLNEAFILVLMMKSLLFWSMITLKVLCENWSYNLNIKWAYPI